TEDERRLARALQLRLAPWQRGDGRLPTELDRDVIGIFTALFEKSNSPQHYLPILQQFYQASHDFRLLACVADAVVGHTAAKVYPFLAGMQPTLAQEQRRQLEALQHLPARGSADRLHVVRRYAELLGAYARAPEAIDLLQAALKEFQDAPGSALTAEAQEAVTTLVSLLEGL